MNREAIARIIEGIMCPDWYPEEVRVEASQRVADQIIVLQPELKVQIKEVLLDDTVSMGRKLMMITDIIAQLEADQKAINGE